MLQPLWMWKSALTLMILAFGGVHPERAAQAAGEVDPVEREDHVGRLERLDRLRDHRVRRRRAGMQRMIGREAAADLEVGDDLGVERLRERDALVPAVEAARHPAHQDDRMLAPLEHRGGFLDQLGRRAGDWPAA